MSLRKKLIIYAGFTLVFAIIIFAWTKSRIAKLEFTAIPQKCEPIIERIVIEQGDILALTFDKTKLSKRDAGIILAALSKNVHLNRIRPGDFYEVVYSPDGNWTDFWFYPSGAEFYSLAKSTSGAIKFSKEKLTANSQDFSSEGVIKSSLWEGMISNNVPSGVILSFADIFAWQMDFLTDTRDGDTYKVYYELDKTNKKDSVVDANILAAKYKSGNRIYAAYYFKNARGEGGYFDESGKSLRSAFLKAPLQFSRISSYFSTGRMHPILKYVRAHLGIDYAAPSGTPVSAIGDGTVIFAGFKGQNGNLVIVKHSNGYETTYGHLSGYGKGVRSGARVRQGQIIGYVGSTGLSTGPHLDFRIKRNGTFFNFLTMKQPPTVTLQGADKANFNKMMETQYKDF